MIGSGDIWQLDALITCSCPVTLRKEQDDRYRVVYINEIESYR